MNLNKTSRTLVNLCNSQVYRLYTDPIKHDLYLFPDTSNTPKLNEETKRFYSANFSDITIRLNTKKEIVIPAGYFYPLQPNEIVTHNKLPNYKQFRRLKND